MSMNGVMRRSDDCGSKIMRVCEKALVAYVKVVFRHVPLPTKDNKNDALVQECQIRIILKPRKNFNNSFWSRLILSKTHAKYFD